MVQIISPERYFFIYAFPALDPGALEDTEYYKRLEGMLRNGSAPSKQELERLFPHACKRVDVWSVEGIREYWWKGHTELIDEGMDEYEFAPEPFKIQCKVRPAIIHFTSNEFSEVVFKGETNLQRVLAPSYLPVSKGDYVTAHLRKIVEKINAGDYESF